MAVNAPSFSDGDGVALCLSLGAVNRRGGAGGSGCPGDIDAGVMSFAGGLIL